MFIHKITIQNFKAFKSEEVIDFEGKNALIFGNNGSGKSSLYYALHVFLQSSIPGKDFSRYFDKYEENGGNESLLNIYADPINLPYKIELQLKTNGNEIFTYQLKKEINAGSLPSTDTTIELSDFSSDFISHRLLANFYNFRNSESANVWLLSEKEVFPYWKDDVSGKTLFQLKKEIEEELKMLSEVRQRNAETGDNERKYNRKSDEYIIIIDKVYAFNKMFTDIYSELLPRITEILNEFLPAENLEIDIKYWIPWDTDLTYEWLWNKPELNLELKVNNVKVPKLHTFLNEARLTALALAIRLAMFERRFKGTEIGDVLKVLVLDDLLISLDLSFRMKLVKYLQSADSLKGYQIIFLTHEKGLFDILQQTLAEDESKWKWFEFFETNSYPITNSESYKNPLIVEKKDALLLAEEYLKGKRKDKVGKVEDIPKDYELCALYIRKKTEQLITRFYDPEMESIFRFRILKDLSAGIAGIKSEYIHQAHSKIETILSNGEINEEKIKKLIDLNFDNTGLSAEDRQVNNKLISFKRQLLDVIKHFYQHDTNFKNQKKELEKLSKEMNLLRSRIMNKGAHHDGSPIFELELRGAIDKIKEFEQVVLKVK